MSIRQFPDPIEAYNHMPEAPLPIISVTDIERLAKAGVVIKWEEVKEQVRRDEHFPAPYNAPPRTLEDGFWERWQRARPSDPYRNTTFIERPYLIAAHQHGDKVSVFVQPYGKEPFVLQDERCLFPSDALMASLALWEKTNG